MWLNVQHKDQLAGLPVLYTSPPTCTSNLTGAPRSWSLYNSYVEPWGILLEVWLARSDSTKDCIRHLSMSVCPDPNQGEKVEGVR